MNPLRSALCKKDVIDWRSFDTIFSRNIIGNSLSYRWNSKGMSVAASTDNFLKILICFFGSINIYARVSNKTWIQHTRQYLSIESYWLLFELLGIANVTECDLVERIFFINIYLLLIPLSISFFIVVAKVGTMPLTAYWAYSTFGFI